MFFERRLGESLGEPFQSCMLLHNTRNRDLFVTGTSSSGRHRAQVPRVRSQEQVLHEQRHVRTKPLPLPNSHLEKQECRLFAPLSAEENVPERSLQHLHNLFQNLRYRYMHKLLSGDLFLVDGSGKLNQEKKRTNDTRSRGFHNTDGTWRVHETGGVEANTNGDISHGVSWKLLIRRIMVTGGAGAINSFTKNVRTGVVCCCISSCEANHTISMVTGKF